MAQDQKNGSKVAQGQITTNGTTKTIVAPLVVVDGKLVSDTSNVRLGVTR